MVTTAPHRSSKWLFSLLFVCAVPPISAADPLPGSAEVAPPPRIQMPLTGDAEALPIDLPTALRLVNVANPTIALAQERARGAYLRQQQAELSWLPDLVTGPAYARHDGQIQNSAGIVFGTSKSSLLVAGGAALSWDTTNIYFGPLIARRLAAAQAAAAQTVTADTQLETALTYLDMVRVHAALAINGNIIGRAEQMVQYAAAGAKAGMGKTPADLNRALTELNIRQSERIDLQGDVGVVSARLAQLLLLQPTVRLRPEETSIVPIVLVPPDRGVDELVGLAMQNRPELQEGRYLEEAARARYQQARVSPFVPRLDVTYTAGLFGGGFNSDMANFSGRSDGLAQAIWRLHNFGAGDIAEARVRRSEMNQADYYVAEVQARVAAQVAAAASLVQARQQALLSAQGAVVQAREMWRRLERAAFGMADRKLYDPLEPLLAEQALAQARFRYLDTVVEYNKAQFRLYWAIGQPPACALEGAAELPLEVPVVPSTYRAEEGLPMPQPLLEPK
jgi:outer membrane protein TolC